MSERSKFAKTGISMQMSESLRAGDALRKSVMMIYYSINKHLFQVT
jgi:hypothetical protein